MTKFVKFALTIFLMSAIWSCSMVKKLHHLEKEKTTVTTGSNVKTLTTITEEKDTSVKTASKELSGSIAPESLMAGEILTGEKDGLSFTTRLNPKTKKIETKVKNDSETVPLKFKKTTTIQQTALVHQEETKKVKEVDNSKEKKGFGGCIWWVVIAVVIAGLWWLNKRFRLI